MMSAAHVVAFSLTWQQPSVPLPGSKQPLLVGAGVLARNHPYDQHIGEGRERSHTGVRHQPQHVGTLPRFLLNSCSYSNSSIRGSAPAKRCTAQTQRTQPVLLGCVCKTRPAREPGRDEVQQ